MTRLVRVVGAPASGKSTLAQALATALGLRRYSIDNERLALMAPGDRWPRDDSLAWRRLRLRVAADEACIVETGGTSANESWLTEGHETFTVCCVASDAVRRSRLIERARSGHPMARTRDYVIRLTRQQGPSPAGADATWNGDAWHDPAPVIAQIRAWMPVPVGA